jgi:hypothetical protein
MNRTGDGESLVVIIGMMAWTVLGAEPAGGTLGRVDITGTLIDPDGKVAWFALKRKKIRIGEYLDIWRPTGLYKFRRENSERAVIRRKRLVKLSHDAAYHRAFLHQINVVTKICKIQGGLHSGNSATDDHH